jgi:hypothetical protein
MNDLKSYQNLRDRYTTNRANFEQSSRNNQRIVDEIKPLLEKLKSYNTVNKEREIIDFSFLEDFDAEKLIGDPEYHMHVREQLHTCKDKLFSVLDSEIPR